jgi:hypothetical protein
MGKVLRDVGKAGYAGAVRGTQQAEPQLQQTHPSRKHKGIARVHLLTPTGSPHPPVCA